MVRMSWRDKNGRVSVGIGLSRENVNRMMNGKPAVIDAEETAGKGVAVSRVMVFFGETEESMFEDLAHLVGPETEVQIDPRVKAKMAKKNGAP